MNDTAIKNFCMWARTELMSGVRQRMMEWDISADADPSADAVNGLVLSASEKKQRTDLIRAAKNDGEDALVERAAYTWFNRMLAIRFMEVNDRLPSGVRVFSGVDGSFAPQVLKDALSVDIEGLNRSRVLELVQDGDDEATFRYLFLAQCDELAACMPDVFERVGSAMELLLPAGLLRQGGVPQRLVDDIPEADWREGVEIVGWAYQYYNAERKNEYFASKRKATRDDLAPATQLFTPNYIVRYLVDNSVGRLWMLNNPGSAIKDSMEYYVDPGEDHEHDSKKISSPEELTVIDPACGSGHILVYAFDLLARIYEDAGYSRREIPQLVLAKNISGLEIDSRAAAMASFALTMKAMEYDSRFLRRGVTPRITVLERIEFEEAERELIPSVAKHTRLMDALEHLNECGSLFVPEASDLMVLKDACDAMRDCGDLFSVAAFKKLQAAVGILQVLSRQYATVVANPPYMASSTLSNWFNKWVSKEYPDSKRDLCTCFIERGFSLAEKNGYSSMVTMQSWMFLGSFEALRKKIIKARTIATMAHIGTRGFDSIAGEVVSVTAASVFNKHEDIQGTFLRLVDNAGEIVKSSMIKEAITDLDCDWLYCRNTDVFSDIPGSPIAYWISASLVSAFSNEPLGAFADARRTLQTGDAPRFMRSWQEVSSAKTYFELETREFAISSQKKWFPFNYGGPFRKWYGNLELVVNWENNGQEIKSTGKAIIPSEDDYFSECLGWSKISSDNIAFRYSEEGLIPGDATACLFNCSMDPKLLMGYLNSSSIQAILDILNPTLNYPTGDVAQIPVIVISDDNLKKQVSDIVQDNIAVSRCDWNSFETSWDFKRNPLV